MVRKILMLLVILLSLQHPLKAQQKSIDSLLHALNEHKEENKTRLDLLNKIAFTYKEVDIDKGIATADKAIDLALKLNNQSGLAEAHKYKATNLLYKNDYSLALQHFNQSLELFSQLNNNKETGIAYNNIAITYYQLSNTKACINNAEKALSYSVQANDTASLFKINRTLGVQYTALGEYYKSIKYLKESYRYAVLLNDKDKMAAVQNSLGIDYLNLSDYPQAIEYYLKAMELYAQCGNKKNLAITLVNIGIIYEKLGKYDKALNFEQRALKIQQETNEKEAIANTLASISNIYSSLNQMEKTMEYLEKSLKINRELGLTNNIAVNLSNMGIAYFDMAMYPKAYECIIQSNEICMSNGNKIASSTNFGTLGTIICKASDEFLGQHGISPSKRFDVAIEYQKQAISLAKEINALEKESYAWENLSKTYEVKKDFNLSLNAYKQYIALRDSIFNEQKTEEITRKEMQFEYDKKDALTKAYNDKQQALANAEIKRQTVIKNSVMGGAGVLLLSAAFSFVFYKRRRDAEKQKIESDLKAEISDVEMKALRSQMNPHFIFNSLNSISEFVLKNDTKAADNYLAKFAKVMRMILENSEQKAVPLSADLKVLELYMQLEALRMNNKFNYEIVIDPSIDADNTLIPPLILQPFVENSIWHGIAKKDGYGKIKISIIKENDMINCTVEDDGVGRANSNVKEGKSLGMKITNERIQLLNKLKKAKAAIALTDLAQGFKVEVRLPLELSF